MARRLEASESSREIEDFPEKTDEDGENKVHAETKEHAKDKVYAEEEHPSGHHQSSTSHHRRGPRAKTGEDQEQEQEGN